MWRFVNGTTNNAQPSAFSASDLTVSNCPGPKLVSASAKSLTEVVLTFDRSISATSITNAATQFTFTGGLTSSAAQVTGRQVTLTTSAQTPGTSYTVTVASSVTDRAGTPVVGANNTATFKGYRTLAVLRINEVQPSVANSRDLVELLVLSAGTTDGIVLQQDLNSSALLATLPDVTVAAGDLIVVHLNPVTGTGATVKAETTAKDEAPAGQFADNYDTAWDFVGGTTGITLSNRLLVIKDPSGAIQDGVAFAKSDLTGTPPAAFPGNLQALQATGQWLPADCAGTACTYTSAPTAIEVAADWKGIPASNATKTSVTIRRVSATDTNTKDDWAVGAHSWGAANP
nr:Ig-like domain-containing protein [Pyxidicoccus caerfyrddinensis]